MNFPKQNVMEITSKVFVVCIGFMHSILLKHQTMMIILRGGTIEQLTFILSEVRAALAVTNPGRGSRQPHTEQL